MRVILDVVLYRLRNNISLELNAIFFIMVYVFKFLGNSRLIANVPLQSSQFGILK